MSSYDLCSAVFELRSERQLAEDRFMGQAAQKIFLAMLSHMTRLTGDSRYNELAVAIHPPKGSPQLRGPLPYTVSDWVQPTSGQVWIRVTGLEPRMCDALAAMVEKLPGCGVDIPPRPHTNEKAWTVHVQAGLLSGQDWTGQTRYQDFVDENWKRPPNRQLCLDFTKPTVVESVGVERPFPEPTLIFRLLYERLQKIEGLRLPFAPETERLEAFTSYLVGITDYEIACKKLALDRPVTGFSGWVIYELFAHNESLERGAKVRQQRHGDGSLAALRDDLRGRHDEYVCLAHLLAALTFYSGIGRFTAQGLGMVRKVERHAR
jgi:hypothetical protein